MNLPAGTPLKTGLDVANVDFYALVKELGKIGFNGYVCIATAGEAGFEEGTLMFDEGKPVASIYEYYKYRKTYFGDDAFKRVLNASAAKDGVVDVFELTKEQVHLVLAFNEKAISVPGAEELAPRKIEWTPQFERQAASSQIPLTRDQLLRKYKLAEVKEQSESSGLEEVSLEKDPLAQIAGKKP